MQWNTVRVIYIERETDKRAVFILSVYGSQLSIDSTA